METIPFRYNIIYNRIKGILSLKSLRFNSGIWKYAAQDTLSARQMAHQEQVTFLKWCGNRVLNSALEWPKVTRTE